MSEMIIQYVCFHFQMHQKVILAMFIAFVVMEYIVADESFRFSSGVTRQKQVTICDINYC